MILTTILLTSLQVIGNPVLALVLGQSGLVPLLILLASYLGMAAGAGKYFPAPNKYLFLILGLSVIGVGMILAFDGTLFFRAGISYLVAALFFLVTAVAGWLLRGELYDRNTGLSFSQKYSLLNFCGAATILLATISVHYLGIAWNLLALGLFLAANFFRNFEKSTSQPEKRNTELGKTILLGAMSAGYLVVFFQFSEAASIRYGYGYYVYLFATFLFLGLSRPLLRGSEFLKIRFPSLLFVQLGFLLLALLLILLAGTRNLVGPLVDPIWVYSLLPAPLRHHVFLSSALLLLLLAPYLFFAAIVPAREKEAPGHNHLFACLAGNLIGLILFQCAAMAFGYWMLVFLVATILLLYTRYFYRAERRYVFGSRVLFLPLVLMPFAVERGVAVLNLRLWPIYWNAGMKSDEYIAGYLKNIPESNTLINYENNYRGIPTIIATQAGKTFLSLGGYTSFLSSAGDEKKGDLVADYAMRARPRKILLLGLGNHIVLARTVSAMQKHKLPYEISVVDNYLPFREEGIRKVVGGGNGFSWNDPAVSFISADAVNYLAENRGAFDLVIWNLAYSAHPSGMKLFTREFSALIRDSLKSGGAFVGQINGISALDCAVFHSFPRVHAFSFGDFPPPAIASKSGNAIGHLPDVSLVDLSSCADSSPLTFSSVHETFQPDHFEEMRRTFARLRCPIEQYLDAKKTAELY
ncbi:MAG: hypothetical protein AB7K68_07380 [Bacteriovoracia bacterium]